VVVIASSISFFREKPLYQAPVAFAVKPSHLHQAKRVTATCGRCFTKKAELLCPRCKLIFCLSCWALIPHHRMEDIVPFLSSLAQPNQKSAKSHPNDAEFIGEEVRSTNFEQDTSVKEGRAISMFSGAVADENASILNQLSLSTTDQLSSSLRGSSNTSALAPVKRMGSLQSQESFPEAITSQLMNDEDEVVAEQTPPLRTEDGSGTVTDISDTVINDAERDNPDLSRTVSPMLGPTSSERDRFRQPSFGANNSFKEDLVSSASLTYTDLARPPPTRRTMHLPVNDESATVSAVQLSDANNSGIFIDEQGRMIPKLAQVFKSSKSVQGFEFNGGFQSSSTIQKNQRRNSSADSAADASGYSISANSNHQQYIDSTGGNISIAHPNPVTTWAELDVMRTSNVSDAELQLLSPSKRAQVRQAEVDRVGAVSVAAAERIRMAKKYSDITIADTAQSVQSRKIREGRRKELMMVSPSGTGGQGCT
jgi:hypothetical protein